MGAGQAMSGHSSVISTNSVVSKDQCSLAWLDYFDVPQAVNLTRVTGETDQARRKVYSTLIAIASKAVLRAQPPLTWIVDMDAASVAQTTDLTVISAEAAAARNKDQTLQRALLGLWQIRDGICKICFSSMLL
jgi:hypothetical protein